jgi:spermidine synthase
MLAIAAAGIAFTVPPAPRALIAGGRKLPTWGNWEPDFLYVGEGMNASIAVSEFERDDLGMIERDFQVSGKVVASSTPQDMRLQRMLGHLPALVHAEPKSVLVVGCGAGVTAGTFVNYFSVERIVICEIEPLIPPAAREYFDYENHAVLTDDRTQVVLDDARHYVLTCNEKFDIVTSDPIHPWVKGAASLYSREYFELCKQRLNPGGVVTQWVPLYETNTDAVKSQIATFFEVFPHGTIWTNDHYGGGYYIVLLGQLEPTVIDLEQLQERLEGFDYFLAHESLKEVGLGSSLALAKKYAGCKADLRPWLADAQLNLDRNMRLQYLAGFGLNLVQENDIHEQMLAYRKYPERLFVASSLHELELRKQFARKDDAGDTGE